MRLWQFALVIGFALGSCKARQPQSESSVQNVGSLANVLIAGLDGPSDTDEINRAITADAQRCLANPYLFCRLLIPARDASYAELYRFCKGHPRCQPIHFGSSAELLEKMTAFSSSRFNVRVGLLIGHHTGDGIWDHPTLTPDALDTAATFPLVLRICSSDAFAQGHEGLVAVGSGLLAESDVTHVEIIRSLLSGARP